MKKEFLDVILSEGIWTIFSFFLVYYILKTQERRDLIQLEREKKYQEIIYNLNQKFKIICDKIQDITNKINK